MTINVDASAVKRIENIRKQQGKPALVLRITVEGGGCSGFQYKMELTENKRDARNVYAGAVATDDMSLPFLNGSTIRFDESLIGSEFVIDNPNASSGCGCGNSFAT
ncbi:MAG: iron-sulfur cluster assembly accessory protein [Alphaproteobacteria bacterium]|nr:iron-sulfur cluster assembly accessory protein [Alphaproteobacteria bacterium]